MHHISFFLIALIMGSQLAKIKNRKRVGDYWARKAKAEKYPARSVFKLEEINRKHRIIKPGDRVLDLGASPGSWLKYSSMQVGKNGLIVGLDLKDLNTKYPDNTRFINADVFDVNPEDLAEDGLFQVVLSDMAPSTSGIKNTDQARSLALARAAFNISRTVLEKGGSFLVKIFEGPDVNDFVKELELVFSKVHRIKPKSSRRESVEFFGLGLDFKALN